jgi:hypothetical protein
MLYVPLVAGREIVKDDDLFSHLHEFLRDVGTDESGPSGY